MQLFFGCVCVCVWFALFHVSLGTPLTAGLILSETLWHLYRGCKGQVCCKAILAFLWVQTLMEEGSIAQKMVRANAYFRKVLHEN